MLLSLSVFAQNKSRLFIDSLIKEAEHAPSDTSKIKILDKLSYAYSNINPDSGILVAEKALNLSKEINWEQGIAGALADLGINYQAKSEFSKALEANEKALEYYEKAKQKKGVAAVLSNIALIHKSQGNYSKALESNQKALTAFEEINDTESAAITLENIGSLYLEFKKYDKAIQYFSDAVKINKQLDNKAGLARNMGNIGIVYNAKGNYLLGLESHVNAWKINKELGNKNGTQINLANIGISYIHLNKFQEALKYQLEALAISEELGSKSSIAINMGNIGETYYTLAKENRNTPKFRQYINQSISYLEQSVALCKELNFLAPTTEFIPYLSEAYALSGNNKKAYEYYKEFVGIKDSIFSAQTMLQISNLESKRQMDIKEKDLQLKNKQIQIAQLEIQQRKNARILYILGIALLIVILGVAVKSIITYRRSNRSLTDEKEMHLKIIMEQLHDINAKNEVLQKIAHMQSHDIRGRVATILGLAQLLNREDFADPSNKVIINGIVTSTIELDDVIKEVVKKENMLKKYESA